MQADAWSQQLNRSQQAMRQLAGTGTEDVGGDDSSELTGSASGGSQPEGHETSSMQVKVDVNVQLGEVALFVSGRCAEVWWPAEVRSRSVMVPVKLVRLRASRSASARARWGNVRAVAESPGATTA